MTNVTAAGELNVLASAQPGVDIGDVTVNNGAGAGAVNIQDGGNSITVDGTVSVAEPVSVDDNAGSLTVDAPVGTPVNVQIGDGTDTAQLVTAADNLATPTALETLAYLVGFDSATYDRIRTVSALGDATTGVGLLAEGAYMFNGTTWDRVRGDTANGLDVDVTRVPAPLSTTGGGTEATALRVTVANDSTGVLSVDDNGGSLTVDAVDLDIRNLDVAQDDVRVGGMAASDAAVADNPVAVGGRASTALPTAVNADGDAVFNWLNRSGALVVAVAPHIGLNSDPYNLLSETAQYTTTQTSTVLVAGGASEKIVVTKVLIQAGGTTAGALQLYFGTGAYVRGTNRAIFDGEFAPSATLKPGVVMDGPFISGTNGDDLLVTTSAAINPLTITVWYYVVT